MNTGSWVSGGAKVADPQARQRVITTPDGRQLGVAEYGPADGTPLFSLHGTPGARYGGAPPENPDLFEQIGVRVIGYDRPGYGLSTRHPGRRVADAAADLSTVADHLGVDRFAVEGGSGGGPHCLAVATLLPDRVTRAAAVVSVAPFGPAGLEREEWLAGQTQGNVEEFTAALSGEAASRKLTERLATEMLAQVEVDPANFLGDAYELADGDRALLADPRRHERTARMVQECLRTGVDGWVDDVLAFVTPWGFDVHDLRVPVMVWFGMDDTLVPPAHGEWLARSIPGAAAVRMTGGHLELAHRIEDLLRWLVGGPLPDDATTC